MIRQCPRAFNWCAEKFRGYKDDSLAGVVMAKEAHKNQGKTNHPNIPTRKKGKTDKTERYKPNM